MSGSLNWIKSVEPTKNTRDSFSSRHSCISLRAYRLIRSLNLSKRTVAVEDSGTSNVWVLETISSVARQRLSCSCSALMLF